MRVYRITKSPFIRDVSGFGARIKGGRWNRKGAGVIYTSESRALAALEYLVHVPAAIAPANLAIATIEIPENINPEEISLSGLPNDWKNSPPPPRLADIGTKWLLSNRSLLLRVPSAILSSEFNVLINPLHPDITGISIRSVEQFQFDPRLKK